MEGRTPGFDGGRPIAKPVYALPQAFDRAKNISEPSLEDVALKDQRARFYRKGVTESGAPVYGFVITVEEPDNSENH